ncbi:MAG: transglutaminase domain-containing protein [Rhodospirillales bacterium]|nr:transglutaminase domain-containing protein [Rhodospirillales bacterium]
MTDSPDAYTQSTHYIDSDHPDVIAFAKRLVGDATDPAEKAKRLYYGVRDEVAYDPYRDFEREDSFSASGALQLRKAFCVGKAALMAAAARAVGVPARLGLADVRNHLATPQFLDMAGTDMFIYHGFTEVWVEGKWVKATPTFNLTLCEKFGVKPLDFDGRHDALFHPFDINNRKHMEYTAYRGQYADVPAQEIRDAFKSYYPKLYAHNQSRHQDDFGNEALANRKKAGV